MATITAKQKALEVVQRLPPDATLEDVIEQLYFLHKVERGLAEADAGETVSHEEALAEREHWRA
jgi:predicted transcriptional regulator